MEKSFRKHAPKASPRPLFKFGKWSKTVITCKKLFISLEEEDTLKKDYKKTFSNPVLFDGQYYEKQ